MIKEKPMGWLTGNVKRFLENNPGNHHLDTIAARLYTHRRAVVPCLVALDKRGYGHLCQRVLFERNSTKAS